MPRAAALSVIGIVALGSTRLIYNVVVGRVDGPGVLGRVGTGLAFAMFASLLAASGTAPAAAKFGSLALSRDEAGQAGAAVGLLTRWTTVAGLTTIVGAGIIGPWVLRGLSGWDIVSAMMLTAGYVGYTFTKGMLYGTGQVLRYAILEVGSDVVALGLTVAAVAIGSRSLLIPLVIGYLLFTIAAFRNRPRGQARDVGPALRSEMRRFVGLSICGIVASTGFLQLSMLFAKAYSTGVQAGFFAAIISLVAPLYFLPRGISLALFPAMAAAYGSGESARIARYADLSTRLLVVVMVPVVVTGIFLAGPVLVVGFGRTFAHGGRTLAIMLVATFISIVPVPAVNSLSAVEARYVKVSALASISGLVIGVSAWVAFGHRFGVTAVALGYLAGSVVQGGVPVAVAWHHYRLQWAPEVLRLVVAAGAVVAIKIWLAHGSVDVRTTIIVSAMFVAAWMVLMGSDIRLLWRQVRPVASLGETRRRRPGELK